MINGEKPAPRPENTELHESVTSVGALFGFNGAKIDVRLGNTWQTAKTDKGIVISVNPHGLGDGKSEKSVQFTPGELLYGAAHEVGHAVDMLSPGEEAPRTPADAFFWNVLDDTVINSRLHALPMMNEARPTVYAKLFPTADLTEKPKHIQFMYSLLLRKMVPESSYGVDPEIDTLVSSVQDFHLPSGRKVDIVNTLARLRTTLAKRRQLGKLYIKPIYDRLLKDDMNNTHKGPGDGDGTESFEEQYAAYNKATHGERPDERTSGEPADPGDDIATAVEEYMAERAEEEVATLDENVSAEEPDNEELQEKLAGYIQQEMNLDKAMADDYAESLRKNQRIIKDVSDLFLLLAARADVTTAPRFEHRADQDGKRLHPLKLGRAALQSVTREKYAIWQPVTRRGKRQEIAFGGLDVRLLVDVSGSMEGLKAHAAASTAQVLIEGLELAKYRASQDSAGFSDPDVRTQVIAFGSSYQELSPLAGAVRPMDKGSTYYHLRHPESRSTYIGDALHNVRKSTATGSRDNLIFIITDGVYTDAPSATRQIAEMSDNCRVLQVTIGGRNTKTLYDSVDCNDVNELPERLYGFIRKYADI